MMAVRMAMRAGVRAVSRGYATEAAAASTSMRLTLTSPGQSIFDEHEVSQVNIPASDGEFGVLPSHVPVIATLKPGVLTVLSNNSESRFFVSSGTAAVNQDSSVQIIAEEIAALEDLDLAAAKKELETYTAKLNSSDELEKAEAEIAVDVYSAMVKALE